LGSSLEAAEIPHHLEIHMMRGIQLAGQRGMVLLGVTACLLASGDIEKNCHAEVADPDLVEASRTGVLLLQTKMSPPLSAEARALALIRPLEDFFMGSRGQLESQALPQRNMNLLTASTERRRCGADGCRSAPVAPLAIGARRTYVFVMGVEGAGHHAVCPLLEDLFQRAGYQVRVSPINMFGRAEIMPFNTWKSLFLNEMKSWCPSGICLNCMDSFPYERPIQPSAAPDFARMAALDKEGLIDLRVVSIMRNMSDSVFSALRRFPSDPVQAVSSTRHFLMEVVRNTEAWSRLHCERLATLRFENLVGGVRDIAAELARTLGLSTRTNGLAQAMAAAKAYEEHTVHESHKSQYRMQDPVVYDKVSSWLSEKQDFLWPELNQLWCM